MTNHPNRSRPRAWITPPADVIRELRAQAGITQVQAAEMTRAALRTWEQWERGDRRMPAATMELWCIALAVGTVAHGPYVPPGDWMLPWVRNELALWFRRPASFAPADAQDMRRFADALRADPDAAREFFRGAGILDADGRLAPPHAQAVE